MQISSNPRASHFHPTRSSRRLFRWSLDLGPVQPAAGVWAPGRSAGDEVTETLELPRAAGVQDHAGDLE